MKNIFAKFQEYVNKPKRNVFDMSFRNNLTLKFGELTPVFCKEVIPGDSFKIHTAFGLQLMPMKFPVQTPMKAYIHFFYVRNRTIWKDWMDFIGGTKENLVLPYVTPVDKKKFFRVGGLADYLGVPNVLYQGVKVEFGLADMSAYTTLAYGTNGNYEEDFPYQLKVPTSDLPLIVKPKFFPWLENSLKLVETADSNLYDPNAHTPVVDESSTYHESLYYDSIDDAADAVTESSTDAPWYKVVTVDTGVVSEGSSRLIQDFDFFFANDIANDEGYRTFIVTGHNSEYEYSIPHFVKVKTIVSPGNGNRVAYHVVLSDLEAQTLSSYRYIDIFTHYTQNNNGYGNIALHYSSSPTDLNNPILVFGIMTSGTSDNPFNIVGDDELSDTPYDSDIHLNALPFRAYEAIYNAYYRNPQNNPFVLDGVPEYNRYVTNLDGGADSTQYDLYYRNWEYDFLTSAVQSPQQGIAPLVGMSVTGEATFADEEGNTYYAQAILNDAGEITGWQSHSSNMPVGSLRLLMDMAGTGISINDLRNVNAFQRFLENNIRHGLKYKDQVMSHFGVNIRYDELDMPEFIGGVSTMIDVNKLSQTSNSGDTPLGSFVGQASALAESNHDITHYCDEHGFIMGIMSVVPVPVYSQLLPKFFVKNTHLDYYFPEFGHIGYQPILQKEVSPLQTYYSESDLNKVFGYNRAWYDYLASTDEVHAQFRTTMRDFIMNRTFETEPDLSEEFLLVDPNQLNDVFLAGTNDDLYSPEADKIIGSILFNVSAKRPIPLFGIPKLEA